MGKRTDRSGHLGFAHEPDRLQLFNSTFLEESQANPAKTTSLGDVKLNRIFKASRSTFSNLPAHCVRNRVSLESS